MKSHAVFALCGSLLVAAFLFTAPQDSTAQAANTEDPALLPLILDAQKQQQAVVENQARIDAKLAAIAEDLRVARIFVSRGGKQ
jgi:hypothetical protein